MGKHASSSSSFSLSLCIALLSIFCLIDGVSAALPSFYCQNKFGDELLVGRYGATAVSIDPLIYFIGGQNNTGSIEIIEVYDSDTGNWGYSSLEWGIRDHSATSLDDKFVVACGQQSLDAPKYSGKVYIQDTGGGGSPLQEIGQYEEAVARPGLVSVGGLLIVAGGMKMHDSGNPDTPIDNFYVYNLTADAWDTTRHLSEYRAGLAATAIEHLAFFAAGTSTSAGTILSKTIDVFDTQSMSFLPVLNLTTERTQASIAFSGPSYNKYTLFIAGGRRSDGDILSAPDTVVEYFEVDPGINSFGSSISLSLYQERSDMLGISLSHSVFFAGGLSRTMPQKEGSSYLEQFWFYQSNSNHWSSQLTSVGVDQSGGSVTNSAGKTQILIAGGRDPSGSGGPIYDTIDTIDVESAADWERSNGAALVQEVARAPSVSIDEYLFFSFGEIHDYYCSSGITYLDTATGVYHTHWDPRGGTNGGHCKHGAAGAKFEALGYSVAMFGGGENCNLEVPCFMLNDVVVYNSSFDPNPFLSTYLNLSVARRNVAAAAAPSMNTIIFAGGETTVGTASNAVDVFNVASGLSFNTTLPDAVYGMAGCGAQGVVGFGGGYLTDSDYYDKVVLYEVSGDSFTTRSLSGDGRYGMSASSGGVESDLLCFCCGREQVSLNLLSDIYIYNITADSWSVDDLYVQRYGGAMASVRNLLVIAGGNNMYDRIQIVDLETMSNDSAMNPLRHNRRYLSAASYGNSVYFAGGFDTVDDTRSYATVDSVGMCENGKCTDRGACECDQSSSNTRPPFCAYCPSNCTHGSCSEAGGCDCTGSGYSGAQCEICDRNCSNGGFCDDYGVCNCTGTGWDRGGEFCEFCDNCFHGNCYSSTNLTCNCTGSGYHGENCTICDRNCTHGGVCNDTGACNCTNAGGFNGEFCEIDGTVIHEVYVDPSVAFSSTCGDFGNPCRTIYDAFWQTGYDQYEIPHRIWLYPGDYSDSGNVDVHIPSSTVPFSLRPRSSLHLLQRILNNNNRTNQNRMKASTYFQRRHRVLLLGISTLLRG